MARRRAARRVATARTKTLGLAACPCRSPSTDQQSRRGRRLPDHRCTPGRAEQQCRPVERSPKPGALYRYLATLSPQFPTVIDTDYDCLLRRTLQDGKAEHRVDARRGLVPGRLTIFNHKTIKDIVAHEIPGMLTFLHISDLHFGHGNARTRFDQKTVVRRLLDDVAVMAQKLGPPDWVLVTGDIAFSAHDKQYFQAEQWLAKLRSILRIPVQRILAVPGNHDIDRGLAGKTASAAVHDVLRQHPKKLDEYIDHPDQLDIAIWPKLAAYAKFVAPYSTSSITPESPFWRHEVDTALGRVVFAGLNTALLSHDKSDAPTNLLLGNGQLHAAIVEPDSEALLIVLQHHPPEWLADGTDMVRLIQHRPHLVFSGHVHDQGGFLNLGFHGGELVHLVAGAGHDEAHEVGEHGYAWVSLSASGLAYYPRKWSRKNKQFRPASSDFEGMVDGCITYAVDRLPKALARWLKHAITSDRGIPNSIASHVIPSTLSDDGYSSQPVPELFTASLVSSNFPTSTEEKRTPELNLPISTDQKRTPELASAPLPVPYLKRLLKQLSSIRWFWVVIGASVLVATLIFILGRLAVCNADRVPEAFTIGLIPEQITDCRNSLLSLKSFAEDETTATLELQNQIQSHYAACIALLTALDRAN